MDDLLYQYNPWWETEVFLPDAIRSREQYLSTLRGYLNNRSIIFLTGLRRVGKTTLMKLLISELIGDGIDPKHIFYISVDDFLLRGKSLHEVISSYRTLHRISVDEKVFVFLDEITALPEYHQQLKNLYDSSNCKIYASSSSSSLLLDKKAYLTGRSLSVDIRPLDFEEFKQFKGITVLHRDEGLNETYFRDYIRTGGIPENVLYPSREYLNNLVDDIIQKDITAYHGLKNHQLIRDFFVLLMERSGKQVSINKLANILKISPDTAKRYLSYFQSVYLIHAIPRYGKTNERVLSAKKIYACDLGVKYLVNGERDLGSYFENYIYLKLRDRKDLYYLYENGIEIDFITGDGILIESKYNSTLREKQKRLYESYPASRKVVIDSVRRLSLLDTL